MLTRHRRARRPSAPKLARFEKLVDELSVEYANYPESAKRLSGSGEQAVWANGRRGAGSGREAYQELTEQDVCKQRRAIWRLWLSSLTRSSMRSGPTFALKRESRQSRRQCQEARALPLRACSHHPPQARLLQPPASRYARTHRRIRSASSLGGRRSPDSSIVRLGSPSPVPDPGQPLSIGSLESGLRSIPLPLHL